MNAGHQDKELISDDDENETIFKKSNSVFLNSLFEESRSRESCNESSPSMNLNIALESSNSEGVNLQNSEENKISESENISSSSSPVKTISPDVKIESINGLQEKNQVSNLTNDHRKLNILKNNRSTLLEDSKLVKISLPTNAMNLMQSNAQFLNKSRNFFNFITEKSSNIMEKTLLPHNITNRYNSILKLTDSGVKKQLEDSSTSSESSSIVDFVPSSETNSNKITTDEAISSNVQFKDESGLLNFENCKSFDGSYKNNSPERNLKFEERQGLYLSNNFPEKCVLDNKMNPSPLESQENSPRPISEEDSVVESSCDDSIDSSNSTSPNNEVYLTLLHNLDIKENEKGCENKIEMRKLEEKDQISNCEKHEEIQREEIVSMERTIERLTNELKNALTNRESLNKELIVANKDRECMVMKYAVSEKQLIDVQR